MLCVREFNIYTKGSHWLRKCFLGNVTFVKINNQVSTTYLSLYLEYLREFFFSSLTLLRVFCCIKEKKKNSQFFKLSYLHGLTSISSHLRWVWPTFSVFPIYSYHESCCGFSMKTPRCLYSRIPHRKVSPHFKSFWDCPWHLRCHKGPRRQACGTVSPRDLFLRALLPVRFPLRPLPFGSCWGQQHWIILCKDLVTTTNSNIKGALLASNITRHSTGFHSDGASEIIHHFFPR